MGSGRTEIASRHRVHQARYGAMLFSAGAVVTALGLVLPHPPEVDEHGLAIVAAGSAIAALVMRVADDRLPDWTYQLVLACGTILVSLALLFNGERNGGAAGGDEVYYLSVVLYSAYYFGRRAVALQVLLIAAAYAATLALIDPGPVAPSRWLTTTGLVVGTAIVVRLLSERIERLISELDAAARADRLTGLANRRAFEEQFARDAARARRNGLPLALLLADVDDFKQINDRFGHPVGDRVLAQIAGRLRQGGEGFRLGGDEFAVLLPAFDGVQAHAAATSIVERVAALRVDEEVTATVSAGVATYPSPEVGRDELIRFADGALYWAKEHGKNQVRVYHPDVVELAELKRLASGPDRAARYRAAASLAQAVDARDAYTGSHSERVAELAARAATQLGVDQEVVELTRLAARLHDLGKLAIPEELLRKPGPLTEPERLVLERHPQIGFRMLESLGVDPLADWVLHHHERWDGAGYPDGLAGEAIPLGARIIFVADAYDAMVSDRVYRERLSHEDALRELRRCARSQFDPAVVDAFTAALGASDEVAVAS